MPQKSQTGENKAVSKKDAWKSGCPHAEELN